MLIRMFDKSQTILGDFYNCSSSHQAGINRFHFKRISQTKNNGAVDADDCDNGANDMMMVRKIKKNTQS